MQASKQQQVSASTQYRYSRSNRKQLLSQYILFKNQYQHYFPQEKINQIKEVYQHGICGKNSHKHTVIVDRIGQIKIHELSKVLEDDQLVHYTSQRLINLSEHVLQQREQIVWIVDLNGKIMQLASKKIMDSLQKIIVNLQKYFPQLLNRLVFVNTPMLFDTIWSKFTSQISKSTLQKIIMIGDDLSNLYQYAEQNILPQFLGGCISQQDFICENKSQSKKYEDQQQSQEEQFDFSSLKQALSGLKISGNSLQSVSQTPLNTEADDK